MKRLFPPFAALCLFGACTAATGTEPDLEVELGTTRAALTPTYQRVIVDPASLNNPWMKSIADLNGDGLSDLIVANDVGSVVWYTNPKWSPHTVATNAAPSESGSATGDIDRDGDTDIVVGQFWFENAGNGSSWTSHALPAGVGTHDIMVVDINRDGKPDIVSRGENGSTIAVMLQQASPTSFATFRVEPGVGRNGLDVADINRDGLLDIVVGGVWMQCPQGDISTNTWTAHTFATWNDYASVVVQDINRDGFPDIVLGVSEATGNLSWFQAPSWTEHVIDSNLTSVHAFVVADVDRNGTPDVVASEYAGAGRLILYLNQGATWSKSVLGTDSIHNVRGGDLNNDGTIDFFGAAASGSVPVLAYISQAQGCTGSGGAGGTGGAGTGGALGGAPTGGAPSTGGAATGGAGGTTTITIGEASVLSTDDNGNGNLVVAQPANLRQTATVQSLSFYVASAAGKLRLGIYDSNAAGDAQTLKAATAEITPVVGWNTANVTAPVSLAPGKYWLAYAPSTDALHFRSQPGGLNAEYFSRTYQALPASFATSFSTWAGHWSFYATLTVP